MIRASLPPRGVFVPTRLIVHPDLPSAVLVTWIQLRCIAWSGWPTTPLSIPELAAQIGIHPARLRKHLAHLRDITALDWHIADHEKIIISFPEEPYMISTQPVKAFNRPDSHLPISEALESQALASYFPKRILGYLRYENDEEDDLSAEKESGFADDANTRRVEDLSKLAVCKPIEHTFVAK